MAKRNYAAILGEDDTGVNPQEQSPLKRLL
jgi:hypothetical protein